MDFPIEESLMDDLRVSEAFQFLSLGIRVVRILLLLHAVQATLDRQEHEPAELHQRRARQDRRERPAGVGLPDEAPRETAHHVDSAHSGEQLGPVASSMKRHETAKNYFTATL